MVYLVFYVCCAVGFLQSFRYGMARRAWTPAVVAVNYAVAAAASGVFLALFAAEAFQEAGWGVVARGCANGVIYVMHIMVLLACYRFLGVGITSAVAGMGMLAPIFVSWAAWGEGISVFQWVAVGLLPFALLLIRPGRDKSGARGWQGDLLLLLNWALAGAIGTIHKSVSIAGESRYVYQFWLFCAAAVCSGAWLLGRTRAPSLKDVGIGAGAGLLNAGATLFFLAAIGAMPAAAVYPTAGCSVVCANIIIGWAVWKERLRPRQMVGAGLALAVVALVNLR